MFTSGVQPVVVMDVATDRRGFCQAGQGISADIGPAGLRACWSGTNLQYPDRLGDIRFRIISGEAPAIEFKVPWPNGVQEIDTFTYDSEARLLRGVAKLADDPTTYATFELSRDRSFYVYKDYARYLAGLRITPQEYTDDELARYGQGYLVYLPEDYED